MSNEIDHIFYINLEHRTDRKQEIEKELSNFGLTYERFPAIPHIIGGVGCGTSHMETIKLAKKRGYKNVLIFEDDFEFIVSKKVFEENIEKLFSENINFDVCFLAYNLFESSIIEGTPFLRKVLSSQTASAYIVNSNFYDDLIDLYSYSVNMFERHDQHWIYSIDQSWKQIQPLTNWVCFEERLGKQRASMSDNTCVFTDYGC